jgi:hypothetical protein
VDVVPYKGFFTRITIFAKIPQNTAIFYFCHPLFAIPQIRFQ